MKTTKEIFQALIDGKKLHFKGHFLDEQYIMLNQNDNIVDEDGSIVGYSFEKPEHWHVYREHFDIKRAAELIRKGKTIKREAKKDEYCYWQPGCMTYSLTLEDILATDYYILDEKND